MEADHPKGWGLCGLIEPGNAASAGPHARDIGGTASTQEMGKAIAEAI